MRISLPFDRDHTGQILVEDAGGAPLAGPFRIAARCADSIAGEHGNPLRAPTLPYGDPPAGEFRVKAIVSSGAGSKYRPDLYGSGGAIVLLPVAGDAALADANGRFEILIHGGALSVDGRLRATSGHFRVSDDDLVTLCACLSAFQGVVRVSCLEQSRQPVDPQTVANIGSLDETETELPPISRAVARHAVVERNLVAFGEYSPGDLQPIGEPVAAAVGYNAESVANDYATRGVTYSLGGSASDGGDTSDCSHFVNDVLTRAGLDVPYTTTAEMPTSEHFDEVGRRRHPPGRPHGSL
jgi:hypothetical protein